MLVCVIGAGVIGCATALELRRRGFSVMVIDRNGEVGHGSTSASCGIVRRFYSQPGMVAMAHEAAHIWDDWGSYLGAVDEDLAVFHRPGMLFIPPRIDEAVRGIVDEMKKVGIRVQILSADEMAEKFPFLDTASSYPPRASDDPLFLEDTGRRIAGAVYEEDAGYVVSPGLATHNLRLAGEREGVRFLLNCDVVGIQKTEAGKFRVETASGTALEPDVLINIAGPHSATINRMAGAHLPLETRALRREVHALANPLFDPETGGGVPIVGDLDGGVYFRPEAGGRDLIVGSTDPACDELEWVDNPDEHSDTITEKARERQCLRMMKRFPRLTLGPRRGVAAMYDVTVQDWYPIADKTDLPGYFVCIGTSGSSFKTAPVLGQLMAQMVQAHTEGQDTDEHPVQLELPHAGVSVDTSFLSRLRGKIDSTGTVIG